MHPKKCFSLEILGALVLCLQAKVSEMPDCTHEEWYHSA